MHDRRVGDRVLTLGNQGALFMRAMTWWDHETGSIWSQPWGAAIDGELKGTRLELIPAAIEPLQSWTDRHQDSLVLVVDGSTHAGLLEPARMIDFFVIGVMLGDAASAYRYADVASAGVINDRVGSQPIAVFAEAETGQINVFLARLPGEDFSLTFQRRGRRFVDEQTGSTWSQFTGKATAGPLEGRRLQRLAFVSSYDWAWEDFFPHSRLYDPSGQP